MPSGKALEEAEEGPPSVGASERGTEGPIHRCKACEKKDKETETELFRTNFNWSLR